MTIFKLLVGIMLIAAIAAPLAYLLRVMADKR